MQLKPIDQQVVAVVGASSGIGRETALRFARRGAKVVVSARSEHALRSLVDEIRSAGGEATAVIADVSDYNQVKQIADQAASTYGRLDTWTHLAAVSLWAPFDQTTPEEFKRIVEVNLLGQVYGAMAALPHLKREGRGALIHVSSVEAKRSFPLNSAYGASKHGIDGFIEALRVELKHEGWPISVTQVLPATINTPLFDKARTKLGVKPKGPPPFYQPGTVADVILYAAEHPSRDLLAGGAARTMVLLQKLSPRLMDAFALQTYPLQRTDQPKPENAPNNLFQPVDDYARAEGDFGKGAFSHSLYNWLETHPLIRHGAMAGAAVAAGLLGARMVREQHMS